MANYKRLSQNGSFKDNQKSFKIHLDSCSEKIRAGGLEVGPQLSKLVLRAPSPQTWPETVPNMRDNLFLVEMCRAWGGEHDKNNCWTFSLDLKLR